MIRPPAKKMILKSLVNFLSFLIIFICFRAFWAVFVPMSFCTLASTGQLDLMEFIAALNFYTNTSQFWQARLVKAPLPKQ